MRSQYPALTRRHFEFIASIIRELPDARMRSDCAKLFGQRLKLTNGAFKYNTFIEACKREGDI